MVNVKLELSILQALDESNSIFRLNSKKSSLSYLTMLMMAIPGIR